VVLKALPEEHTYDYQTADETYMAARNIKRWMQFPDSEYVAPDAPVQAEQAQAEPSDPILATWPERIWLQWNPDDRETYPGLDESCTWSDHSIHRTDIEYVRADRATAAPAAPVQTAEPTDLSKRLRQYAARAPEHAVRSIATKDLIAAADEIDRYYGGMMAWKQTAEKKDRDWNAERMGRENDRIAARVAAPVHAALEQAQPEQIARVILKLIGEGAMDWKAAPGIDPDDGFNSDREELNVLASLVNKALAAPTSTAVRDQALADAQDAAEQVMRAADDASESAESIGAFRCVNTIKALRTPSTPEASEQQGGQQ
jgi:hypothetical protein